MDTGPNSTELKLKADTAEKEEYQYHHDKKESSVSSTIPYSLFSVRVTVRHTVESDEQEVESANIAYKQLVCRKHTPLKSDEVIAARIKKGPSYITGFAVGEVEGLTIIVTSSLGIKEALPLQLESSSLIEDINRAFKFEVMCLHEEEHKKAGTYEIAKLLSADDRNGLLLIEANVKRNVARTTPSCMKEVVPMIFPWRSSYIGRLATVEVHLHVGESPI